MRANFLWEKEQATAKAKYGGPFDCGAHDEAVGTFAQDDRSLGEVGVLERQGQGQKKTQIPFGDDNQNGNGNSKGKGKGNGLVVKLFLYLLPV